MSEAQPGGPSVLVLFITSLATSTRFYAGKTTSLKPCASSHLLRGSPPDWHQQAFDPPQPAESFEFHPFPTRTTWRGSTPPNAPLFPPYLHLALDSGRYSRQARPDLQAVAIALEQRPATRRNGPEKLVERIRELLYPLLDQFLRDLLQRDAANV